jgi:hypothetical protein
MIASDDRRSDPELRRIVRTRGVAHAARFGIQVLVALVVYVVIRPDEVVDQGLPTVIRLAVLVGLIEFALGWTVDRIADRYRRPIVDGWLARQAAGPGLRLEPIGRENTRLGRIVWLSLLIVIAVLVWLVAGNIVAEPGTAIAIGLVVVTFVVLWEFMNRDGARVPSLSVQPISAIRIDRRGLILDLTGGGERGLPWHEIRRISMRRGLLRARVTIESISDRRLARIPLQLREPVSQEPVDLIRVVEALARARFERATRLVPFGVSTSLKRPGLVEG